MPLKKYQQIRRFIHFTKNSEESTDRFHKVRPVVEKVRLNCLRAAEEENQFSIDEMTLPYKGKKAGNRRQYNVRKPKKWGFKAFVRSEDHF
ncbi:putative ankyrin 2,3/unc44 [Operophtera brumata]|uniref:Putative ankyrin 2,3/unc44 n=1 Tax=Operophtera brumata TaxID=104452 RepID=A0A0L7LGZ7_OPEBR|nr:putative ankyrin 2,3/unc44 [Operophtera brumata]